MAGRKLILPEGMKPKGPQSTALDTTTVKAAGQLLDLIQQGLTQNRWPNYVQEFRSLGLQDDLALVYHALTFHSSRGYILGLKAAEAAARAAHGTFDKANAKAARHDKLEDAEREAQRAHGAGEVHARILAVLDRVDRPGV